MRALARYFAGRTVTVEQVLGDIRSGAVQIPIVACRHHARSDVQDLFVCLCAMGLARPHATPGRPAFAVSAAG